MVKYGPAVCRCQAKFQWEEMQVDPVSSPCLHHPATGRSNGAHLQVFRMA
jgi:hypothetical protein